MGIFRRRGRLTTGSLDIDERWPDDGGPGFVVVDLETTGLSPLSERVIEIALIQVDVNGTPLGFWSSLINPERPVAATEIHGLTDSDLVDSPTFHELLEEITTKMTGRPIVAHNARFDLSFLREELRRAGGDLPAAPAICTMLESRYFLPGLERTRLQDCIGALGLRHSVVHRASEDAALTATLFGFYLTGPVSPVRSSQIQELAHSTHNGTWVETKSSSDNAAFTRPPTAKNWRSPSAGQARALAMFARVGEVMPEDIAGHGAEAGSLSYAELLLETIEDGRISDEELNALSDCAASFGISHDQLAQIHGALLVQLALEAWRDGTVQQAEQRAVLETATALGLSEADGRTALKAVEEQRQARISARARVLPTDWQLGDPLRVGDRIAITGCYERGRFELEASARKLGIRVTGSISGKTKLLVSDGTIGGVKDTTAARLGLRIVSPEDLRVLLEFVQPPEESTPDPARIESSSYRVPQNEAPPESLVCVECGVTFQRVPSRGRKPHRCPSCRSPADRKPQDATE